MDRLFDRAHHPEDDQLALLAELELRLERQQRWRRGAVAAMALASALCWFATAFTPPLATTAPPLFALCTLVTVAAYGAERRTQSRRRALVAQLPAQTRRLVCAA